MAIVVNQNPVPLTIQNIVDAAQRDETFTVGTSHAVLVDYVNRIQLQILRMSRWSFLLSVPLKFITELGQTDYWIGTSGGQPVTVFDTGLNRTDIDVIKKDSVFDRTNFKALQRINEPPGGSSISFKDALSRPGLPSVWRQDVDTPNIINLYPAPDNKNSYQPVPEAPASQVVVGGAQAGRFYYIQTTLVDSNGGESLPSTEAKEFIPTNNLITVVPPQVGIANSTSGVQYNQYNVYASTTAGQETKQNLTPIFTTNTWTEPNSGLTSTGAKVPTSNTLEQLGGYVIEFRYYAVRPQISLVTDNLVLPTKYKDVIIAGVNWLACRYLSGSFPEAAIQSDKWEATYKQGLREMVGDRNMFIRDDFMRPDTSGVGYNYTSGRFDIYSQY